MKSIEYFKQNLIFSIVNIIIFSILINKLENFWFTTHIFLCFAYLIIIIIGIFGLSNQKNWSPALFIILFSTQAIDAIILLITNFQGLVVGLTIISIVALYCSSKEADLFIKIKRFQKIKDSINLHKKK